MLSVLLIALALMAACVATHAVGVAGTTRRLRPKATTAGFWSSVRLLVRLAGAIVIVHLVEIVVWALFYAWREAMPDLPSAIYFSAVTYTTTGYGDLVLPKRWQLLSAVEALTGILMCGWSSALFFVVVTRLVARDKADAADSA